MLFALGIATLSAMIGMQTHSYALADVINTVGRDAKFSIFNIIKFENAACIGGSRNRNGTCFTAAECESNGGEKDGECADGFGVCCVTMMKNGQATSLNISFITSSTSSTGRRKRQTTAIPTGPQTFTICPCASDVCRMRFDFTMFTLAGPNIGEGTLSTGVAPLPAGSFRDNALGHCQQDQFSIMGAIGGSSPVICGTNTGQHMIIDNDGSGCSTVHFGISGIFAARVWDIRVMQFRCGEEIAGPPGCLQYFTGANAATGIQIRSFNFPAQADGTAVAQNVVHLASQKYSICIRRETGMTTICYVPCTQVTNAMVNAIDQQSFGVSLATAANTADVDSNCSTDYITIPQGMSIANAILSVGGAVVLGTNRFCGRGLATMIATDAAANLLNVCTTHVPFTIGVVFNEDEATSGAAGAVATDEYETFPGAITGFCLRAQES